MRRTDRRRHIPRHETEKNNLRAILIPLTASLPMNVLYPAGFNTKSLPKAAIALKIARHSRCLHCSSCPGLRPSSDVLLSLDSDFPEDSLGDLAQYGSDDEDRQSRYLNICVCGHDTREHGADKHRLGEAEYARRARVAIRIDELLSVRYQTIMYSKAERLS